MSNFRKINYGKMLLEALRAYFSVNTSGIVSQLYRYCAAGIQPLQAPFDDYDTKRTKNALIASCKWQMGQTKNVLNYLYDTLLSRIYIDQSVEIYISDPIFEYDWIHNDQTFDDGLTISERTFGDRSMRTPVIIHVPSTVDMADLVATVAQIALDGIVYEIVTI